MQRDSGLRPGETSWLVGPEYIQHLHLHCVSIKIFFKIITHFDPYNTLKR